MNIALFSDSYIPTKSGVVTVVIQLRKILEELGHHVVIVTVSNGHYDEELEMDENLLRIHAAPSPVGNDQYFGLPNKHKIIKFLKKNNIELIHAHTEFSVGQMAVVAGKKLKIPVIATTHTMWEDYYRYYLSLGKLIPKRAVRKAVKIAYKRFFALLNVSQKAKDYFTQPKVLPNTPCAIVPNAIDTKKFIRETTEEEKIEIRNKYGISKDDKVILYVGRVVEEKRVEELLNISKGFVTNRKNVKMVFVGSGAPLNSMKKTVEKWGLSDKIIFTGFIDWNTVSKIYAIGDVFVTVSLSEMHSMTILEALSLGLPAVCRKDSSFADTIFHGENGFECDSDEEVEGYIYKILDDEELCKKMKEKALEVSSRFTLRLHGLRTEAFYKVILENYPKKVTSEMLKAAVDAVE